MPTWVHAGVWLLVVLTAGVAFLAALLLWRNGYVRGWRKAKSDPPKCLKCGYNLSGLTHCRCPECGKEYRLEELWASPPLKNFTGEKAKQSVSLNDSQSLIDRES